MSRVTASASGAVASFRSPGKVPIRGLKVNFSPVQSGSGDPSPSNVRPITGWTGVNVARCEKNLFNEDSVTYGRWVSATGVIDTTAAYACLSQPIPVNGGEIISAFVLGNSPFSKAISQYDKNGTFIERSDAKVAEVKVTVTTNANAKYVMLNVAASNNVSAPITAELLSSYKMMVVKGDTVPSSYEPYHSTTFPIIFPSEVGTIYGGSVDLVTGELTVTHKSVILTGYEGYTWIYRNSVISTDSSIVVGAYKDGSTMRIYGRCNMCTTNDNGQISPNLVVRNGTDGEGLRFGTLGYWGAPEATPEAWVTRLKSLYDNGTPIQICYELATPLTYTLTPQQLSTLIGYNNIYSDADSVEVEYDLAESEEMMRVRQKIMSGFYSVLPAGYRKYDYLQAEGDKAVIDTGVPGNNDNLSFNFKFNVDRFIAYRGFFTNYADETSNCWRLSEGGSSGFIFNVNTKTGASTAYAYGSFLNKDTEVTLNKSTIVVYTNGTTYTREAEITAGTTNNTTIYINSSRRYARTNTDVIKWYYFKIHDNGKLIRNYVPCVRISDSKAGFYDLVNHTFNPSIGSAEFVAGND